MGFYSVDPANLVWREFWQVTVLAAAVGLIVKLSCRNRPHLAYVFWILVLLKCLTPPIWSSPTGIFSWAQLRVTQPELVSQKNTIHIPKPFFENQKSTTVRYESTMPESQLPIASQTNVSANAIDKPIRSWRVDFSWQYVSATAWLIGAVGLAATVFLKWLGYCRTIKNSAIPVDESVKVLFANLFLRLGLRRKYSLVLTSKAIGPAVFGVFRPVVVIPQSVIVGKTPQQIEPILAHELVHIRRGDTVWGFLQVVVEIIWWFHPLVWWANRQICRERERCCDEEVVAGLLYKPAVYARCLLEVLEIERNWRPILAIPGVRSVEITSKRLEDIMKRGKYFHTKSPRWCWAILAIAALLTLPGREHVMAAGDTPSLKQEQSYSLNVGNDTQRTNEKTYLAGKIVDSSGKIMPNVRIAVVGRKRTASVGGDLSVDRFRTLALAKSDEKGSFQLTIPRLASSVFYEAYILAASEGYGLALKRLGLDLEQPDLTIQMPEEQIIRGRIIEPDGYPAADAKVCVTWIRQSSINESDGVQYRTPPADLPIWPGPLTTDKEGRFTIRGVGHGQNVSVQLRDERFAIDWMNIEPSTKVSNQEITLSPPAAKIFEGQIVYRETGKPVPNARLEIGSSNDPMRCIMNMAGQADGDGRFRLIPYSGKFFTITAYPPAGEPYLAVRKHYREIDPSKSFIEQEADKKLFGYSDEVTWTKSDPMPKCVVSLPRGSLVQGFIIEKPSNKRVAGASIIFEEGKNKQKIPDEIVTGWESAVLSGSDGDFQIVVPAGKGALVIKGPGENYINQLMPGRMLYQDEPGGAPNYASVFVSLFTTPGSVSDNMDIPIQRGVTLRGRIAGPKNQPVGDVLMLSRIFLGKTDTTFRAFGDRIANGGQFELHGLDPEKSVPVFFLDAKNQLGAVVEISGKSAEKEPLLVHLKPCGKAVARFIDPDGKPLVKHNPGLQIVVTPGPSWFYVQEQSHKDKSIENKLTSDQDFVANFDRLHYWNGPVTDEQGRCTFPALIPGATYRIFVLDKSKNRMDKDFTVASGETLDLGDIVVKE